MSCLFLLLGIENNKNNTIHSETIKYQSCTI